MSKKNFYLKSRRLLVLTEKTRMEDQNCYTIYTYILYRIIEILCFNFKLLLDNNKIHLAFWNPSLETGQTFQSNLFHLIKAYKNITLRLITDVPCTLAMLPFTKTSTDQL